MLAHKRWTHQEVEYLHEFAETKTVEQLTKELCRAKAEVVTLLHSLGIDAKVTATNKKNLLSPPWTEEENEYLRKNWRTTKTRVMAVVLDRTKVAVRCQLKKIGLVWEKGSSPYCRAWTTDEDNYLRENWQTKTAGYLAHTIGRSEQATQKRAEVLCLTGQGKVKIKPWSAADNRYIKENYINQSIEELAAHLGRTESAILRRLCDLQGAVDILSPGSYKAGPWSDEEENYLRANYSTTNSATLAKVLNRKRQCVKRRARKLGLIRTPEQYKGIMGSTIALTDKVVLRQLTRGKNDNRLREDILQYPTLLKVQRAKVILNRKIKSL